MARTWHIKPEFYLDRELAQCSLDARLLLLGLWMLADRAGRLENRPAKIKAQVFPHDDDIDPARVRVFLRELEEHRFIYIDDSDGGSYIRIRNAENNPHYHVTERTDEDD